MSAATSTDTVTLPARLYALPPREAQALEQRVLACDTDPARIPETLERIQRLAARFPDHAWLHYVAGIVRLRAYAIHEGDPDVRDGAGQEWVADAIAHFTHILPVQQAFPLLPFNLGCAAIAARDWSLATRALDAACRRQPTHAASWLNYGHVLLSTGRAADAALAWEQARSCDPGDDLASYDLAYALLALGRWREAWEHYEARRRLPKFAHHFARPAGWDLPAWRGEPLGPHQTLVITHEQGLGDAIQCARYAPLLAATGPRVVLEVPAPLVRLLETRLVVPDTADVTITTPGDCPAGATHWVPAMSLPGLCGTTARAVPSGEGYLQTPRTAAQHRRIGVVWAGSREHATDWARSMPRATLDPLLTAARQLHVEVVPLQMGRPEHEYAGLGAEPTFGDFEDTAQAIAACNRVVTVDTSVAHLAGALGVPTWLCLAQPLDLRWRTAGTTTPWYRAMRLYRQPAPGDWTSVIDAVVRDLTTIYTA